MQILHRAYNFTIYNMIEQWVMYHKDFQQVSWNVFIKYSFVSDEDLCCQSVIPSQFSHACVCSLSPKHIGISWSQKKQYLAVTLLVPEQCGHYTITSIHTKHMAVFVCLGVLWIVRWKSGSGEHCHIAGCCRRNCCCWSQSSKTGLWLTSAHQSMG